MITKKQSLFKLGAAYYPDYISSEATLTRRVDSGLLEWLPTQDRMHEDFKRMSKQNIHTIRMGEFAWASVEPTPGVWHDDIFLQALDLAHKHSIEVIFCTPTATPPKWLIDAHPDILPKTRSGQTIPFGSRRHYDFHHPVYQAESKRISEHFARSFGQHPSVVAWQTDNEFGCHNSIFIFTSFAKIAFQNWLKEKYQNTIERLNEDWFTCFWSQKYRSFDEIELPLTSWTDQNPHLELDFRRFSNEAICRFQREQIAIIRQHSPGRPITHNLMTLFTDLCPWKASADLDFVGFDHYQMETEPHPTTSAWQFSLMRSLRQKHFTVLEQQPIQVNWQPTNRRFSFDWLFLWGLQSAFQGANGMLYFSWQRMSGGCEQYHDGIVPHDVRIEVSQQEKIISVKNEIFLQLENQFGFQNGLPLPARDVLCIHNTESLWTHEITAQSAIYSTRRQIDHVTQFCLQHAYGLWLSPDLLSEEKNINQYRLIILPGYAFEFSAQERALLRSFRDQGGRVLSFPRTAYKLKNNKLSPLPATFYDENDFSLEDYGAMLEGERELCLSPLSPSQQNFEGHLWAENIKIQNPAWKGLLQFSAKSLYAGAPALLKLKEKSDSGSHIHLATCPVPSKETFRFLNRTLDLHTQAEAQSSDLQLTVLEANGRRFLAGVHFGMNETSVALDSNVELQNVVGFGISRELTLQTTQNHESVEGRFSVSPRTIFFAEIHRKN